VSGEKTWDQLRAFLACCLAPKLLINAKNIDIIKGLQIGFPNSVVSFFQPWGLISSFAPIGMLDLG
jgi:hypothetical protein